MDRSAFPFLSIALFLPIALAVGGCSSLDPQSAPERRNHELSGDAIDAVVPKSATLLETGHRAVTSVAPADGEVYLFDTNSERLLYTTHVERGQKLTVDAVHDRVAVDGQIVFEYHLFRRHVYQLYLDPGATVAVAPAMEGAQAANTGK